jgi:hypothetical protein
MQQHSEKSTGLLSTLQRHRGEIGRKKIMMYFFHSKVAIVYLVYLSLGWRNPGCGPELMALNHGFFQRYSTS